MSPQDVFRKGANALITGAASGVGLAVAELCASHDMNLILIDTDTDKLAQAKAKLSSSNKSTTVTTHAFDVSLESAWHTLRDSLTASSTTLDFLHLNAGIGPQSSFTSVSEFHSIFDTNFFGVVNGIVTLLPHFTSTSASTTSARPKAIVITGSKQGITNPPGNPAYNASKAALKSVAEQLSHELARTAPHTSVHLIVPGWTYTGLTRGSRDTKPDGAWAPEQVAGYLYEKMGQGKFYMICPDNDVDEETDKKRMLWSAGDVVFGRQPLSRWRDEYKDEAAKTMEGYQL